MISISKEAQGHFVKLLAKQEEGTNIRVFVVNPGTSSAECGVSYCPPDAVEPSDTRLPFDGFDAVVDEESAPYLEEAEIDYVTDQMGSQLTLKAPNAKARKVADDAPIVERLNYMIESEINPQLANHGGQVVLLEITDDG
ncbi:MAG TPA: Fe-S biogenesis protein NfuA, partial [Alteromonas sp.]|nr:Fe-S biogenesis protein NfuA [Alteromonas sp.]